MFDIMANLIMVLVKNLSKIVIVKNLDSKIYFRGEK